MVAEKDPRQGTNSGIHGVTQLYIVVRVRLKYDDTELTTVGWWQDSLELLPFVKFGNPQEAKLAVEVFDPVRDGRSSKLQDSKIHMNG